MGRIIEKIKSHKVAVIVIAFGLIAYIDISNLDRLLHKLICYPLSAIFITNCPDYYDLPIWDIFVSFGTVAAAYFAYSAIVHANKQLEIEQTPYIVMSDRIITDTNNRLKIISLKNIGKGPAVNITVTTDPKGALSIIEGSNPHSQDLASLSYINNWAIDENQVIKGINKQGKIIKKSVMSEIPEENSLLGKEKSKADFNIYIWYGSPLGIKYKTIAKIRHSSYFLKVMSNKVIRI